MWQYPAVESFGDRSDGYLDGGHFWIREFVTGGVFAVRMADSGLLVPSGPDGDFDASGPWPYRRAIDSVRANLDRDRFRAAVTDVTQYTFYLLAPLSMGVDYDWDAMPPVFGLEIWDDTADSFAPVDVAHRVFEEIGLFPIPTVKREVHARDLSVGPDSIPKTSHGSATAAGIELRKKRGESVVILQPRFESVTRVPPEPAGTPASFETWLGETLDGDLTRELLGEPTRSLDASALEDQVTVVAAELGRRYFDEVGHLALADPDGFESGVSERLVFLRQNARE